MHSNNPRCMKIGRDVFKTNIKSWLKIYKRQCSSSSSSSTASANTSSDAALEWQQARPFNEVPRDSVLKLICKFLPGGRYYKLDSTQFVKAMQKEFGDIYVMPGLMGKPDALYTHNPVDFERVFRNEGAWPIRPSSEVLRYHRSKLRADFYDGVEGILATQGEQWSSFRSVVTPLLMQPKNIKMYVGKMAQVNQELVERIRLLRNAETLEMPDNFEETLQLWALESVAVIALDKQLGLLRGESEHFAVASKLFAALKCFFTLSLELEYTPSLWRLVATPKYKRLMQAMDDIQNITWNYTKEAIEKLEAERQQGSERKESEKSVLEKLLKIDKKIATVMAMDLLLGGVDTTTSLTAGALLCLAKNPEKQAKLRAEIMHVLPHKNGEFTADALNSMPYLRACLKEALRIYPLAIGNMRVPQKDLVLSGYQVPKGTRVSMISTTLLQSEQQYARPLEYLPERWLRTSGDVAAAKNGAASLCPEQLKASSPFTYLPFGHGARACLGRRISDLEMELSIARLVRNFQIEFHYPTDNVFKGMLINMPNVPLKFKFIDIN